MNFATFSKVAWSAAGCVLLASACGGSFSGIEGGESGSSGSQGEAGSSSGAGKSSKAGSGGSTGSGGSSTGGTGKGGSGWTAGTANGGAGPGGEECTAPPDVGRCEAAFGRWYHDPTTGLCRPFIYGGCEGNANNYQSLEACQAACSGGSPDYDACEAASDCAIGAVGCCGTCDGPGLTTRDFIAYNHRYQEAVYEQCQYIDIACAPCYLPPPEEQTLKYFVPACVNEQCVVRDLRSFATACTDSSDCKLRSGSGCCESCDGDDWIAVRNDGSFEQLVCGDAPIACPACAPVPSKEAKAVCGQDGRCAVSYSE